MDSRLRCSFISIALTASLLTAGLTGCSTSKGQDNNQASPTVAASYATGPVTITNCEQQVTFDTPPKRIISMNDHVTEVLIAMGVGDRIVGMGYQKATPLPEYKEAFDKIEGMADEYPTYEQILDKEADFVVGGMSSAFSEEDGRSREKLAKAGIKTFKFSEYCGNGFPSISVLEEDYKQLGEILGVQEGAQKVIDSVINPLNEMKEKLKDVKPVPTFFYDSGTDTPFTIGGTGIGQLIGDYAGAKNIYSEGQRPYVKTSWEVIAERQPEAIVVLDYGKTSAEDKIKYLKEQPLMQQTPAVKNNAFVVVPLDDFFESPRLVTSVQTIAKALHPDQVK